MPINNILYSLDIDTMSEKYIPRRLALYFSVSAIIGLCLFYLETQGIFYEFDLLLFSKFITHIEFQSLDYISFIAIVLCSILPGLFIILFNSIKGLWLNVIFISIYITITVSCVEIYNINLPLFSALIGLTVSLLRSLSWNTTFTDKKKEELNKMFGYFLEPRFIEKLLKNPELIDTVGKKKMVTILFADLRGFTRFCEDSSPEIVVLLLRIFYKKIIPAAQKHNGVIDKIIGDAVMILFNEPIEQENHASCAVKAAIDMQVAMDSIQEEIKELTKITLALGIGINSEEVVVGTIGTKDFCDYTALGSGVNLAARIEASCPGGNIYISANTYDFVKDFFDISYAGEFDYKNITNKEKVYTVSVVKNLTAN